MFVHSTLSAGLQAEALARDAAKADAGSADVRTDHRTGAKTGGSGPEVIMGTP